MDCSNCGAPLSARSNICKYCGTVNDTDLRRIGHDRTGQGGRLCPRCNVKMPTIDLAIEGGCLIDRCSRCLGMFFDLGELNAVVQSSVSEVYRIDRQRLAALIEEEGTVESTVKYVKCPVCRQLMNRKNYGARSGVVTDTCRDHGVWLDGGELGRILKWVKAGGQLHDAQYQRDEQRKAERRQRVTDKEDALKANRDTMGPYYHDPGAHIVRAIFRWLSG
ncbi:MAG: zf-TFIIB domain-containing protein [Phycisphaerae bacterium]|jgi:Zn-finger nucleic acid-binding protein